VRTSGIKMEMEWNGMKGSRRLATNPLNSFQLNSNQIRSSQPIQSELEVDYNTKFVDAVNPDAYTRLILDVLRGKQAAFVRDDELTESWKIFTPLLHRIEKEKTEPIRYQQGSRGPEIQDALVEDWGYIRNEDYVMYRGKVVHKSKI